MSSRPDPFADVPARANVKPIRDAVPPWMDEAPPYPEEAPAAPASVVARPYQWIEPEAIEPRDWLLGRMLLRGQAHGKIAPGGYGKTFHTVATALSLVTGRPLLGHEVWGGPKKAWIWNLEDPEKELQRAVQAACKHWGIRRDEVEGRLFLNCAMEGDILKLATTTNAGGLIMNVPLVEALTAELKSRQIDYLDVDPFVSSHGVDENDNPQIDAVTKQWARVALQSGTAISITHHVRKLNGAEVSSTMARGAVSFVDALRSAFVINRMTADQGKEWGIPAEECRRYIRVYDDKGSRSPPAAASDWYFLASVDLGNGPADGSRPSDNVGALEPWTPPDAFADITTDHLRRVQLAIMEGEWRRDIQAAAWVGHAIGPIIGRKTRKEDGPDADADRAVIKRVIAMWIQNGALITVRQDDRKGNEREFVKVGERVL